VLGLNLLPDGLRAAALPRARPTYAKPTWCCCWTPWQSTTTTSGSRAPPPS